MYVWMAIVGLAMFLLSLLVRVYAYGEHPRMGHVAEVVGPVLFFFGIVWIILAACLPVFF